MTKIICSNCKKEYWANIYVEDEYACPNCGYVEDDRIVGQLQGRRAIADD